MKQSQNGTTGCAERTGRQDNVPGITMILHNAFSNSAVFLYIKSLAHTRASLYSPLIRFYTKIETRSTYLVAVATLRKATISFVTSVRPYGTTRLPQHEFSWKPIFQNYSNICPQISSDQMSHFSYPGYHEHREYYSKELLYYR